MAINKEALLAKRAEGSTREVKLPSGDGFVVVRALTRREALRVKAMDLDEETSEVQLLALAMVEPEMTAEEIAQWQEVAPAGELAPVVDMILSLTGMTADIEKETVRRFPG